MKYMMAMPYSQLPHWELSVLSRAVAYPNLSGAAGNIGISQPQLSRLVAKLEESVGVELLDRGSKRKSGWTPAAFRLAEVYASASATLEKQIRSVAVDAVRKQLKIGTLEGLAPVAADFCRSLFDDVALELIELDIHDLHELEELFAKGALDLVFVPRLPGRKKPRYSRLMGYQALERVASGRGRILVLSPFEHATRRDTAGHEIPGQAAGARVLVSNSLAVRRRWLEELGGSGVLPSSLRARSSGGDGALPVHLVGADSLPKDLWERMLKIKFGAY
jgi:DNA-binding transcriptional LysR family regulator